MAREKIKVTIDGRKTEVFKDTTILELAREMNIHIPTLCTVDSIEPYGVCRICLVEVKDGRRTRLVPSCVFPLRRTVTIFTDTERIRKHRRMIISLLLARCPGEEAVVRLARELGVDAPPARFTKKDEDCILCGLCIRACRDVVGAAAIGFEGRGENRRVVTPFEAENSACIACGACVWVCPTKCIDMIDEKGVRRLPRWKREVPHSELDELMFSHLPPGIKPNLPDSK